MNPALKSKIHSFVYNKKFEMFIMGVILINCTAIGAETYQSTEAIRNINLVCLIIYTIEIALRFMVRKSVKDFFKDGWNIFDLFIVISGYIPEDISSNSSVITAVRVLRVFRILKIFKTSLEFRLIVSVMIRSLKSLTYNALVMFIFMYVFAIAGIYFFKLPNAATASPEQQEALVRLYEIAPHAPANSDDPYGTLPEALFTLLRCMTGDDWTDLRYNLVTASRMNLIQASPALVTGFHILWYMFAAFLLINLVVGAVINNYQEIMEKEKQNLQELKKKYKGLPPEDNPDPEKLPENAGEQA